MSKEMSTAFKAVFQRMVQRACPMRHGPTGLSHLPVGSRDVIAV